MRVIIQTQASKQCALIPELCCLGVRTHGWEKPHRGAAVCVFCAHVCTPVSTCVCTRVHCEHICDHMSACAHLVQVYCTFMCACVCTPVCRVGLCGSLYTCACARVFAHRCMWACVSPHSYLCDSTAGDAGGAWSWRKRKSSRPHPSPARGPHMDRPPSSGHPSCPSSPW